MKSKINPIQKRLLYHFSQGKTLSIKNMWMLRISNCSREVIRNFEIPFGIELQRETISWKDIDSNGTYCEYSISENDRLKCEQLYEYLR